MWFDWRRFHSCTAYDNLIDGRCLFCRLNDELIHTGYEVIPFDVPGPYRGKGEDPTVILQSIRIEPGDDKPS